MHPLVLDTNIVLDLLVFQDPAIGPLHLAINRGDLDWITTVGMRDELKRVLTYPAISTRLGVWAAEGKIPIANLRW